ncbi:MAG: energy transducer TonB [Deltaproteobacteria bacterium]|nr:energy transducer TonB [Deltaproteobacteria bacterium]MBW2594578.1 energy transducer TonB [Deltaproteobacteria bacterium]
MPGKDLVIAAVIAVALHCGAAFVRIPAVFTLPEIYENKTLEISLVSAYKGVSEESEVEVHETKKEKNKADGREERALKKRAEKIVKKEELGPTEERKEPNLPWEIAPVKMFKAPPSLHVTQNKDRPTEKIIIVPAMPRYKNNPPPKYPAIARRRGYEGRVLLSATISIEGNVAGLKVKESSGHPVLDRAAVKAVETWEFEPARRMGSPVPMSVDVPVRFVLRQP